MKIILKLIEPWPISLSARIFRDCIFREPLSSPSINIHLGQVYVQKNAKPQAIIRPQALMKKIPPKTLFQDIPIGNKQKIELLKLKIAAGEYCIDPHNIAEKLIATGLFFNMSRTDSSRRSWLF